AGAESATAREAQSANRPSITIPAGGERKYASRREPMTVTGRGAGADWRDTAIGEPEGKPTAVTEIVTDALGAALVSVTCEADGVTVTPVVAANVNGPTTHASAGPTSPTTSTSSRRAAVVPDGRELTRGTWRIRIAPNVAES